jgi:putrescine aminotransferase
MRSVAGRELIFERGHGVWLWDSAGRRYFDAAGSLWYANVGHGRKELADAAAAQLAKLEAYSAYDVFSTGPALELAERVSALAPMRDAVCFFTTGGADAIETVVKLVRRYWAALGKPEKQVIVTRENAYHGVSGYGTAMGGITANREGFGELAPGFLQVPRNDVAAVEAAFNEQAVAAFIGEPVIGAGGVYPPTEDYWPRIAALCREYDVLLCLDEVITGFGRLGEWFGAHRYGIEPDLITVAKGITSGYVPLGGVVVGSRVQEPFWRGAAGLLRHGYTYSGHATACAVALANLAIIEREQLVEHVKQLEPVFARRLAALTSADLVRDVRTVGLLAGIQLADPSHLDLVLARTREEGVVTRGLIGTTLQISPPLVVTEPEIDFLVARLARALDVPALTMA